MSLLPDIFSSDGTTQASQSVSDAQTDSAPSYLYAADNHNIGNQRQSWFGPGGIGDSISNAPKFLTVSVLSGLNSFYNTGVSVGNFLGGDFEESNTASMISGIDSDLGTYYQQNQKSADMAGFLLTSIAPGLGGIKLLNMGQKVLAASKTGIIGENMAMALGLKATKIDAYVTAAANELNQGQVALSSITSSATKALAAGVYQQVLEGAAFETGVQLTMQKSPMLEDQDKSDILWNIGSAGLLGGVLGGAFSSAKILGQIKGEVKTLGAPVRVAGSRDLTQEMNAPANKIITNAWDRDTSIDIDPGSPTYAQEVAARNQRNTRIDLDNRAQVHAITGQDTTLGNMIADTLHSSPAQDVENSFLGVQDIARVNEETEVERQIMQMKKAGEPIPETLQVSFAKLAGDDAGSVVAVPGNPGILTPADLVSESTQRSTKQAVTTEVNKQGFSLGDLWDSSKVSLSEQSGYLQAQLRQIWADKLPQLPFNTIIHENDFPLLERSLKDGNLTPLIRDSSDIVDKASFNSSKEFQDYIISQKKDVQSALQDRAISEDLKDPSLWMNDRIAKITNTTRAALEGTEVSATNTFDDYTGWQTAQKNYEAAQAAKGLAPVKGEETDIRFMPSWAKITKNVPQLQDVDGNTISALTLIKGLESATGAAVDNAVSKAMGEYHAQLPNAPTPRQLAGITSYDTGAGFLTSANATYGSAGSILQQIGSVTKRWIQNSLDEFSQGFGGTGANLARNQEAAIEWETLNQFASRTPAKLTPIESTDIAQIGQRGLIDKAAFEVDKNGARTGNLLKQYQGMSAEELQSAGVFRPIVNDETWDMLSHHMGQMADRAQTRNELNAAVGKEMSKSLDTFIPVRPNLQDSKFIAFVKDPKVTGQGHTSVIQAGSDQALADLVAKAQQARPDLNIIFRKDAEEFYAARQSFDYDQTMSDNYIDSSLKNNGILSEYFTATDPQKILNKYIDFHSKDISTLGRDVISAKYQPEFDWMRDQAQAYSRVETSVVGSGSAALERAGKNPYLSGIKTALDISRMSENPTWQSLNQTLDRAVSTAVDKINTLWEGTKAPTDEETTAVNQALAKFGLNTGYYDAATQLLVNHTAPKNVVSQFVRQANTVIAKLTIGLTPLNAVNHWLGANILRGTETSQIIDAIRSGNTDLAGDLAKLGQVDVTGQGDNIMSSGKLIAGATKDYFDAIMGKNPELRQWAKDNGFISSLSDQFKSTLDAASLTGLETPEELKSRFQQMASAASGLVQKGEVWSGNKLADEIARGTSALVMKNLTDLGITRGVMDAGDQLSYINTFVNRVDGNQIASQRPLIFQGPIGQAVGLFQSFQFNMLQQMFRYVSEGSAKDAAMLLGLQGTFYGLQGLPAFQAINQHIIGTASGNKNHTDMYDAIYGTAGKNLGDLLTYGLPSNLLQTNLYSHGEMNPRQMTVIPAALKDLPLVSGMTKFFGDIKDTSNKIMAGGNLWETMLQGIEHNGISKPLAGIAQTLQATAVGSPTSTTTKGDILASNDLFSIATLARLSGGKPLDEAIVNDAIQRNQAYSQYNHLQMQNLQESVKTTGIGNEQTTGNEWSQFAYEYAKLGGDQRNFNKFMVNTIKSANTSEVQKITQQLSSPPAQKMQLLMGGPFTPEALTQ